MSRRTPPLHELDARRIALIKPSALGDIVHALPVLSALRIRFPAAEILWVVHRSYADLLDGHPDLNEVLSFDRRGQGRFGSVSELVRVMAALRRRACDLVIDLQGLLRTGLLTWWSGAPRRVGLFSAREGSAWAYTDCLHDPQGRTLEQMHAVDRYWLVAEALGVGQFPKRFVIPIGSEPRTWAGSRLADLPRPWFAVHLGTRWETKRWPPAHFADLCQRACQRFGGSVILVGSPSETPLAEEFSHQFSGPLLNLIGQTSLKQLAAVLEQADIMLSNDSGPLHLAVALGRPVVAPFTCTSVVRTGPYGQPQNAVATRVWCAASYRKRCGRLECMAELTPARLWPVLEGHLRAWHRQSA
ncbi:MAG: glycosyltransferase family 9 protein [Gemmatales bacterium]|nr:glycosyltransferase family 9 protein [Gemmatales bacterium]MDW8386338.1 glycosyltransferase family 9 protein [Gemmatales bacterium]